ncbi:MAG TPA: vanadium-dependent haloperoxidase [Vicinamibacterales bacterium]|nr:vanadium-dependent haloperoxidase [Vicinamibacterales bacterium]
MSHLRKLSTLVVGFCLASVVAAGADPVTYWNGVAAQAVAVGRAGPAGLLDLALVHLAVHDAVQAIEGRYRPYHYSDPEALGSGASPAAAVAAAAHRVLVLLYQGQAGTLDGTYNAYLAAHGLADDPGIDIGEAAAIALHSAHYRPDPGLPPNFGVEAIGQWRSSLNASGQLVPFGFYYLAFSTPFALNRIDQFRPQPPPPMTSVAYQRDYDEVKAIGQNIAHPNDDSAVAWFWSVNFVTQWNETTRQLADLHVDNIGDSARLFALLNTAAADAAMAVWDSKAFYNFWRPITAIREGNDDPNPRTVGLTGWTPLLGTPPYPDYVSGANGLTGAFTGVLRDFFGTDTMAFSVNSNSQNTTTPTRHYTSFSQAAQEVVDARILLGIHFRFADDEARRLGERVAHWTFQKFLRPAQ